MSFLHSDDGTSSELQLPIVIPNENDKGKQPLVEQPVPQASTLASPIEETRPHNTMSIPDSHDGLPSELQSRVVIPNVDDKGKKPLENSPMSPSGETRHRQSCKRCFQLLIGHDADYKTSAFEAGGLRPLLKSFGLARDLTKDKLRDMLKLSGYADENGIIDFERFTVFTKDFKLVESLRIYRAAKLLKEYDLGPLGDFFAILEAAAEYGFTNDVFDEVFHSFEMELTDESVDSLVHYANLPTRVKITFDEFLEVRRGGVMQRTGQRTVSRRMDALDKGHGVGRLMAFVSAYTRSDHVVRIKSGKFLDIKLKGLQNRPYFPVPKSDRAQQPKGNAS